MMTTLAIRDLHQAARAITQRLMPPVTHIPLTVQTAYLTCNEFRMLLRLHGIGMCLNTLRNWLGLPHTALPPPVRLVFADIVPTPWCHTLTKQKGRNGIFNIIPLAYLSVDSQELALAHHLACSYADRLQPHAQIVLDLLIKDRQLSYATAATHCSSQLPRRKYFHIKRRLLNQERYFSWTPSSSR